MSSLAPEKGNAKALRSATQRKGTRATILRMIVCMCRPRDLVVLGLHRGLEDQLGAEAGDVLDDLDQLTRTVEQGVELGHAAVGRLAVADRVPTGRWRLNASPILRGSLRSAQTAAGRNSTRYVVTLSRGQP